MSLYADILVGEACDDADVRLDGDTWTISMGGWPITADIPGFPTKEMALAVVRAINQAHERGVYDSLEDE